MTWRRLDLPGCDTVRLTRDADGWALAGVAASDVAEAYRLDYVVSAGGDWRTRRCVVQGTIGARSVAVTIARTNDGRWSRNGAPLPHVKGSDDIDLSFTPATNLLPIRRLQLAVGESACIRAAWLRFPSLDVQLLEQRYTRQAATRYDYESGSGSFRRTLTVNARGMVLDYPGFWIAEPTLTT